MSTKIVLILIMILIILGLFIAVARKTKEPCACERMECPNNCFCNRDGTPVCY